MDRQRDSLETVRHAESECLAWFNANDRQEEIPSVRQSFEQSQSDV